MEKEFRSIETEIRSLPKSRTIEGRGIVFNSVTQVSWFKEKILPEAVDGLLSGDIVCIVNHNADKVVARTTAGTLKLEKRSDGVYYRFDAPNTTTGNDLLEDVRLRNITGSSFGFKVAKGGDKWETLSDGTQLRTITKFARIFDISPVVQPAYIDTTASLSADPMRSDPTKTIPGVVPLSVRKKQIELMKLQQGVPGSLKKAQNKLTEYLQNHKK